MRGSSSTTILVVALSEPTATSTVYSPGSTAGPLREVASAAEFLDQLPQYDDEMVALLQEAEAADECLRYVGGYRSLCNTHVWVLA